MDSGLGANTSLPDVNKLSETEKRELQQFMVNEDQKARVQRSIHSLTDMCFKKCVTSKIGAGTLDRYEEPCMQNCVDRFMDANGLILRQLESLRTKNSL